MKWIVRTAASLFPLSAALSVSDGAAASSIPTVPKVQNADADGFPLLPEVASLFKDVSRTVQGLRHEASTLQEELHNVEQRSHGKMEKQKAAYDQLLKKQEQANQKIQGQNAQRAKSMMKLRDTARTTQAEIKKEEGVNGNQRLKLKALQKQLEQATKATEDALGVSEDAQPTHAKASRQAVTEEDHSSSDETSSGTVADALEEEPPRKSLSFLEIRRAAPATASSVETSGDEEDDYGPDDAEPTQNKLAVKQAIASQNLQNDPAAAPHSPQDWPASLLEKHSDAMSQAPISMWKEDHGEPVLSASQSPQDWPASAFRKHSDAKSQPIESSSAGKTVTKKAVAAVAGKHPHAKSQPAKSSQAGNLAKDAKASTAEPSSAMRKIVSGPQGHQKSMQHAEPSNAASSAVKASMEAPVQETTAQSSKAEEAASDEHDEQQLIEEAGEAAGTDKAQENLMPDADEQSQVLHEGASSSEGMVASLSQGVKRIQVEVQRSEAQLKLHFQKAYKAGKKRHAALIKQSEALDKNLHSMQIQEKKLETTLAKVRATDKTLKQKIRAIGGILNRAVSPITSKPIA